MRNCTDSSSSSTFLGGEVTFSIPLECGGWTKTFLSSISTPPNDREDVQQRQNQHAIPPPKLREYRPELAEKGESFSKHPLRT